MKTLLFDLDDTITQEHRGIDNALLEASRIVSRKYGLEPELFRDTVRRTCREIWSNSPAREYCINIGIGSREALTGQFIGDNENLRILREWAPTYRLQSWYQALEIHGIDDRQLARELADSLIEIRNRHHLVFESTPIVLKRLGKKYRLGLLTNGAPDIQQGKINGSGVAKYFDAIVISGEYGISKPDPRIFDILLEKLNCPASEAAMIGNSLESDIRGARNAGITSVWINRTHEMPDPVIIPDYEIKSLSELPGLFSG